MNEKEIEQEFCRTYRLWSAAVKEAHCRLGENCDEKEIQIEQNGRYYRIWREVPEESQSVAWRLWKDYVRARERLLKKRV